MEIKRCIKCKETKDIKLFYKYKKSKDGHSRYCKSCQDLHRTMEKDLKPKEPKIKVAKIPKEIKIKVAKIPKEIKIKVAKLRVYKPKNIQLIRLKRTIYRNHKMKTDNLFKLKKLVRASIRSSFNSKGLKKNTKTASILGCSFAEFKQHIENKFQPWMNWDNHGKYNSSEGFGWDIDHIIPISSAKTEEDVIKLNHYTNLQPLCSYVNRVIKRDKVF